MKQERVSRGSDTDVTGARAARRAYNLQPTESRTYDAKDGNTVYEVKTAQMSMPSQERGRFQIFKKQHTRLRRRDNRNSAYYVFVVIDGSIAKTLRKNPGDVGNIIASRGGFRDMGHRSGPRHRLPISALFDV